MAKVQELRLTSISIPALGTGTLNFPEDLVAKVLIEEAKKFSSKHSTSLKINQINVVVYGGNKKAVDSFKQQFQVYSMAKPDTNIPKTKRKKFGSILKPSTKNKQENVEDETRGVNVEIVQGNIVEESTDAVGFLVAEDITRGDNVILYASIISSVNIGF